MLPAQVKVILSPMAGVVTFLEIPVQLIVIPTDAEGEGEGEIDGLGDGEGEGEGITVGGLDVEDGLGVATKIHPLSLPVAASTSHLYPGAQQVEPRL